MRKIITCRCKACHKKTAHRYTRSKLRFDPEHPGSMQHRCEDVSCTCLECGRRQEGTQYPYLLANFFPARS